MLNLTLEQVKSYAKEFKAVPVAKECLADMLTPLAFLNNVRCSSRNYFLLESIEGGEHWARYSFVGYDPVLRLKITDGNAEIISGAAVKYQEKDPLNYFEDGEVYTKLADVMSKLDTTAAGKKAMKSVLEEGFSKFPSNQGILIGLINYYITSGEDTDRLFSLLDDAKKNEPGNASLYYVEGNIYLQLGNADKAKEAYQKCSEINPEYEWGYIGEGMLFPQGRQST